MTTVPLLSSSGRLGRALLIVATVVALAAGLGVWRRAGGDPQSVALVRRGPLTATLTATGTLRPVQSVTYRSPVAGREMEISELAPEGTRVNEGDLVARLDATSLERDLAQARQDARQAQMDLDVAEGELDEAEAAVVAVSAGEGALAVDEARTRLQLAQRKADRLREEYSQLKPLMEKGFITRDELARTGDQLDQADEELSLARRRTDVLLELTHPRDAKRAAVVRAQKASQLGHAQARVQETQARLELLQQLVEACRIYALGPGLVVYEEFLAANPRRKLRVGDRVTSSQGIVTIPEVSRMVVDATIAESEVHRVSPGQAATVRIEAFPDLRLTGHVTHVGTLASASAFRPLEEKRFDLTIELDPTTAELRPQMSARADIVIGVRASTLLVPVTAIFERQGAPVVYVPGLTGVETRPVELGESNDDVVEVLSGVREGERLSLTPPAAEPAASTAGTGSPADGIPTSAQQAR